ncbi:hypothetical protein K491DRAFT_756083 [Lophiostoma macrostomum CBS 122681]|uniref:Uncharacterized protein n=1 Tax=Lophiostoma macrostomum CBS 122681 TaxID=1314788 RepID=A0A6A6TF20_9PLEO|nr:hypothetical protein K491DRAFT_756083 [Lophiostoma macrostomum CBS 122681]
MTAEAAGAAANRVERPATVTISFDRRLHRVAHALHQHQHGLPRASRYRTFLFTSSILAMATPFVPRFAAAQSDPSAQWLVPVARTLTDLGSPSPDDLASTDNLLSEPELRDLFKARPVAERFLEEALAPKSWLNHALYTALHGGYAVTSFNARQTVALAVMVLGPSATMTNTINWTQPDSPRRAWPLQKIVAATEESVGTLNGDLVPQHYDNHLDPTKRESWMTKINQERLEEEGADDHIFPANNCCGFSGPREIASVYCLPQGRENDVFASFYREYQHRDSFARWNDLPDELQLMVIKPLVVFGRLDITGKWSQPNAILQGRGHGHWSFGASVKVPNCFVPKSYICGGRARLDHWDISLPEVLSLRQVDRKMDGMVKPLFYGANHFRVHDSDVAQTIFAFKFTQLDSRPQSDGFSRDSNTDLHFVIPTAHELPPQAIGASSGFVSVPIEQCTCPSQHSRTELSGYICAGGPGNLHTYQS